MNSINRNILMSCICISTMFGSYHATAEEVDGLPGYYKFFMKKADLTVLPEETERDDEISAGRIESVHVGSPAPDLTLPDGFGNKVGLRDYIGKKNVVLSTMRTWW